MTAAELRDAERLVDLLEPRLERRRTRRYELHRHGRYLAPRVMFRRNLASGGQRLRGPSELWGWAENSLYLSPLKGKGHIVVEPESKDAIVEPFQARLEDLEDGSRRWVFEGTVQTRLAAGEKNRSAIVAALSDVGLDKQADGGTHVRSTREVGSFRVLKTENKGKAFKRLRVEIGD